MNTLAKQVRRFPDLALDALDTAGLDDRDAAFAHALYDAVIRRWLTLSYLVERCLDRPAARLAPRPAAAMLAGAAQILFLDRVPVHAAVDTAVEWTKSSGGLGASRLVNAVLRKIASLIPDSGKEKRPACSDSRDELPLADGTALVLSAFVLPADPLQRLAVAASVPIDLLRAWSKHSSLREARRLALHALVHPPTILNTAHAEAPLPEACRPHNIPGHHVWTGTHADLSALLESRRDIWVQDPGSSLAVTSVNDLSPKVVIDVCAGMGTKTRQLAATFHGASIIASDVDTLRVKALRRSVDLGRVAVVPYQSLADHAGRADLVLIDAPCSNTGVLARRVEARYRFDRARLDSLLGVQRQIIADSIRLLAPHGRILYSTCSLSPEENRDQCMWAARWHALRLLRERDRLPQGGPGDPPERYSDGSYTALLES